MLRFSKTILVCSLISLVLCNVKSARSADEDTYVPFDLALSIAKETAESFYPEMTPLEYSFSEIYFDIEGGPAVYAFTFASVGTYSKDKTFIIETIKEWESQKKSIAEQVKVIDKEKYSGKKKAEKKAELMNAIRNNTREVEGLDVLVTVICGAKETFSPVLKVFKGLPEHFTLPYKLLQNDEVKKNINGTTLVNTIFLGMFDLAFEFDDSREQMKVSGGASNKPSKVTFDQNCQLVLSRTGKILPVKEIKEKMLKAKENKKEAIKAKQTSADESRKPDVAKQWLRYKKRYIKTKEESLSQPQTLSNPTLNTKQQKQPSITEREIKR